MLLLGLPAVRVVCRVVLGCLVLGCGEELAGYLGVVVVWAVEPFAVG